MEQPVHFYNDNGEKLAGTLHRPDGGSDAGVILGHCFTCSRHISIIREISYTLAREGLTALRFDFSGNGQSEGDFTRTTYTKHIGEMKKAVGFLKEKGISRFGLAGHSMGASIAVLTGAEMPDTAGVCALGGRLAGTDTARFFSKEDMEQLRETGRLSFTSRGRNLQLSRTFFDDLRHYDVPETIAGLPVPLLVVHGDQDEIVSVENAYQAKELQPHTDLMIIPGADHMFSNAGQRREIAARVVQWFQEHLTGG